MDALIKTLVVLAIIGAINWGLVGFFEWNLVDALFTGDGTHQASAGERVIYALSASNEAGAACRNVSPPTDRPSPPIREGSTSGRRFR